ncbi:MAG: efflux RND transporter periplasmic adaptor subunit [Rhodothermaceae bacterium]
MDRKIEKQKWTTKKLLTIGFGGLFAIFVMYTFVFADKSSKLNVSKERITISTVKKGPFLEFIPVTGSVEPINKFFLDVTEGGRIVEKFVQEGAFLKKGDPVIKLENASMQLSAMYNQAQLFQVQNSLRSTRLSMQQTKLRYDKDLINLNYQVLKQKRIFNRDKKLFDKKLISELDYLESKDEYENLLDSKKILLETIKQDSLFRMIQINQLENSVTSMQSNYKIIQRQLDNLTVRAPINGQLTSLNGEIGQTIHGGQNLGRIDNIESYKIEVPVDEYYLARISVGRTGTFTFDNNEYKLVIQKVYPQITDGKFKVDMHFEGAIPKGIRRGQTLHIKLALGDLSEAILVNSGGFYQSTGGQWIFVLDESENFAIRRNIKINRKNTLEYEIVSGLKPGEKVITSSYDNYGDVEKLVLN